ncbi:hypothetical protein EDB92DRAFT_1995248 [Lactarius akahatsu]|uniref:Uncharacterized protein n=1 Tax=Lactarius akahatsu TaxID=416441 RepID=A0AAD4L2U8_9AGAM|nr:hypothetical protein EDB92DRAFT_1995248 [Lactarius akahatsu]
MSPRLNILEIRNASTTKSSSPSGGVLAAAIVLPIVLGASLLVVFTVLWHRRVQRRRAAQQQPVSTDGDAPAEPTQSTASLPNSPLPPPPPSKSPLPAPEPPARRPSIRERIRSSLPGLAARLSGSSGGTRGSGGSRVDPVLPRAQAPPLPFFNSDDMLAPRPFDSRPAAVTAPTQPLPPTPTSASADGTLMKKGSSESERSNGRGKLKVRPLPPLPDPKAPPPSVPIALQPNRLGEAGLPLQPLDLHQQEEEEAVLLVPRRLRGPEGDSDMLPPPYTLPAGTRSRS